MLIPDPRLNQLLQSAIQHCQSGRWPRAEACCREILRQDPRHADALHLLGVIASQVGRQDIAVDLIRQAIALRPNNPQAHGNLGAALLELGRVDEALAACRQAIAVDPSYPQAYNNLGNALVAKRRLDEAITAYRQAIALKLSTPEIHNSLGLALKGTGRLDEAIGAYRQAIALRPDYCEAYNNLGNGLKDIGQIDDAVAAYRKSVFFKPQFVDPHSNLLNALHFHPGCDAQAIAWETKSWNRQHAQALTKFIPVHINDRSPERRLRIGYVSPDFREHPVGRFLLPLLANHDKNQVEIFAYAQQIASDAMTQRLQSCVDVWRNIAAVSDAQAADLIRGDGIDILVDLSMHTAHNRLLVFARKPAPVQVTYLAYCSTTGLETMDYRLSDPYLDPPGTDESVYSERTIRLPETYWCYQPTPGAPEVGGAPAGSQGYVTFGCLNNFGKVSEPALTAWAKILFATKNSQLLLHAHQGSHRQRLRERLVEEGIDPRRVRFSGMVPLLDFYRLHNEIDIALDPFPYGGGTTTCDELWMGVPVISLAGKTAVGRAGFSILCNVGLPELVARTEAEYVQIAGDLANDLPRLNDLRSTLRRRMEQSPLMDAHRFARNIESAYRQMWREWCAGGTTSA